MHDRVRPVAVFDADAIGMIAVIRSLGAAGYDVYAASDREKALGFYSSYAVLGTVHPPYLDSGFVPWLRSYVRENSIAAVIPGERLLFAIRNDYPEFEQLLPDAPGLEAILRCLSKVAVAETFGDHPRLSAHIPQAGIFRRGDDLDVRELGTNSECIYYLKLSEQDGIDRNSRSTVIKVQGSEELRENATKLLDRYTRITWQKHVPGQQLGVSLWRHQGQILAENMVLGHHMYPYRAGSMCLRSAWWHEHILADARQKLDALQWNGVAMLEYKWDSVSDEFWFLEVNPRYWAYLHLDLACGKNFPLLQLAAHFDDKIVSSLGPPKLSPTMRYGPGEVVYVSSILVSSEISFWRKIKSVIEFAVLGINLRIDADLWFPGDRSLYFRSWFRFLCELPKKVFGAIRDSSYVGRRP